MISRRKGPGGPTAPHDHSGAGEGGGTLSPGSIELDEDEPFDFGDIELAFDPAVGADGALVFRDTANGEDRFFIEVGDVARFANQALRMPDDLKLFLGDDEDYSMAFDATVGASGAVVFRDEGNNEDRLEIRVGDVIRLVNQSLRMPDDLDLFFGDDDDYSWVYDAGNGRLTLLSSDEGDILRVADGGVAVEILGDLTVQGQTTEVDDIVTTDVDVQDSGGTSQFLIDGDAATPFTSLEGNHLEQVGGTTDADAGAIRLANAVALNWRSSEDDGDFGWRLDASENMVYAAAGTDRAQFAENGDLSIEGTLNESAAL